MDFATIINIIISLCRDKNATASERNKASNFGPLTAESP